MRPLCALALFLWTGLTADTAAARPLTLAQAQTEAARLAPNIRVAEHQVEVAQAEVQVAGALSNPNLTLLTSRLTPRLSAGLSLPLPLFGQRGTAVAAARADAQAATLSVPLAQNEARYSVTAAWVDLWAAQERALLLARAAAAAGRFQEIAQERFAAGSTARLDVIRTTGEHARAVAEVAAANASTAAAAARLGPWLGGDGSETAGAPVTAAGDPTPLELVVPPLAELHAAALLHPLLRRDHAQSAAALAHVRAEQRQRWPVLSGLLTVNLGDPTLEGTDVIGGASLDLPVLNLRGGAIARARAQESVAQASLELDQRRTLADVQDTYYSLQAAGGRARALRTQVLPALEEAAQLTEDSYREGRADSFRLLEAQRAVVEAHLAAVEALFTWSKTVADLERAVGRKLDAR